ncbi:type IV pilin protein [Paraglaciecola sp.]|uniref:type IV pilin protein n=1 Tax=Paraglaciecola sp. TaxID=1920173 RepID=UPI003EF7FF4E
MNNQTEDFDPNQYTSKTCNGLTLIELMMVVAIIGVISTLVFPSFQNQIQQSRRNDGINQLLRLKLQQEGFRTKNTSYAITKELSLPTSEYYTFSVNKVSATTYELVATAKGSQLADKTCKVLSINQSMQKVPANCFR